MSLLQPSRERSEPTDEHRSESGSISVTDTDDLSVTDSPLFALGRGLFGGILAFMAVDNLRNLEERIGYAESKGAPLPSLSVPATSSSLLVGSIGVALWRAPAAAASAVAAFFVTTTPVMHDFWAVDDPEQKQQETFHFMKNAAILAASLVFLGLGRVDERRADE